jgi:hypothetical protein
MNIYIYILFILAFIERTFFDLGPNVELVTLAMLATSIYLSRSQALKLTFILMAATDLVIGNTNIFLFTWTGFLIPIFAISKLKKYNPLFLGISSNLFFYIWTNLGVWLLDSWGMYSKDLPGLIHCYINGLPFLKNQLCSTLLFVPLGFFILSRVPNLTILKKRAIICTT